MFGTPYYNQQTYQQDLQSIINNAQNKLNQINQSAQQPQTPITQNFQLAPTSKNLGVNYVSDINDVKKELVFGDTLFVNNNLSTLWFKNASGEVRTFELKEVIELDEKDLKINELLAKIEKLEREKADESTCNIGSDNDEPVEIKKP